MKTVKRCLPILLLIMVCTCYFGLSTQAASKIRISKSKETVTAGNIAKLRMQGTNQKAKWTSSNKRVATVKPNGDVYAKKKGSTYIKARIGRKTYTCKVTVKAFKSKLTRMSNYFKNMGYVKPGLSSIDSYYYLSAAYIFMAYYPTGVFMTDKFALLEYDPANMDDTSFKVMDYAKSKGYFSVNGEKTYGVYGLKNNTFLVFFGKDTTNNDVKKISTAFKKFK